MPEQAGGEALATPAAPGPPINSPREDEASLGAAQALSPSVLPAVGGGSAPQLRATRRHSRAAVLVPCQEAQVRNGTQEEEEEKEEEEKVKEDEKEKEKRMEGGAAAAGDEADSASRTHSRGHVHVSAEGKAGCTARACMYDDVT